jgi:hypothetical protein
VFKVLSMGAESYAVLDTIGVTLSQFPSLCVQVGGHCNDTRADGFNQRLSEERAQAVATYLLSRRRNRRVEFLVLNLGEVEVHDRTPEATRYGLVGV